MWHKVLDNITAEIEPVQAEALPIAEFVDIDKYEFAVLLHSDGDHWLSPVGGNA